MHKQHVYEALRVRILHTRANSAELGEKVGCKIQGECLDAMGRKVESTAVQNGGPGLLLVGLVGTCFRYTLNALEFSLYLGWRISQSVQN
jgi:hypothetical protein